MTNRLCLDLGTKTGWSLYHEQNCGTFLELSGMEDFSSKRFEGGGMRYLNFRKWLDNVNTKGIFSGKTTFYLSGTISTYIDEIYFEEVNHCGWRNSASVYGGFLATLSSWCEEHKIPYKGVPVTTIKKFITGKGNANKESVIKAVQSKGYNVEDDNHADAIAMSLYVRSLDPKTRMKELPVPF